MLIETSQIKTNTMRTHLYVRSKTKKTEQNRLRYRKQTGGCWRGGGWGMREIKRYNFPVACSQCWGHGFDLWLGT